MCKSKNLWSEGQGVIVTKRNQTQKPRQQPICHPIPAGRDTLHLPAAAQNGEGGLFAEALPKRKHCLHRRGLCESQRVLLFRDVTSKIKDKNPWSRRTGAPVVLTTSIRPSASPLETLLPQVYRSRSHQPSLTHPMSPSVFPPASPHPPASPPCARGHRTL